MTDDLELLTAADARTITDRIKVGVEAIWELIKQAYTGGAWRALGYASWDDYCAREFGTSRLRLPREERSEVVSSLRESGLSIRAIASATGHDTKTIQSDLRSGVGNSHTSQPIDEDTLAETLIADEYATPITGLDGKTYQPPLKPKPVWSEEERRLQKQWPAQPSTAGLGVL